MFTRLLIIVAALLFSSVGWAQTGVVVHPPRGWIDRSTQEGSISDPVVAALVSNKTELLLYAQPPEADAAILAVLTLGTSDVSELLSRTGELFKQQGVKVLNSAVVERRGFYAGTLTTSAETPSGHRRMVIWFLPAGEKKLTLYLIGSEETVERSRGALGEVIDNAQGLKAHPGDSAADKAKWKALFGLVLVGLVLYQILRNRPWRHLQRLYRIPGSRK